MRPQLQIVEKLRSLANAAMLAVFLGLATSSLFAETHSADSDPGPVDNRTVPSAPTGVSAVGGLEQAVVSFSVPFDDGGASITGYTVTASPGGATGSGTSSPITVSGLSLGSYTFTVVANNALGVGPASAPAQATSSILAQTHSADSDPGPVDNRTVPSAPTGVSAVGGLEQAVISFSVPFDDGGASITGYTVTVSPGGATASGTGSPITVSGLYFGTYTFTVTASNTLGVGLASAPAQATSSVLAQTHSADSDPGAVDNRTVPGAPTEVSAVGGIEQAVVSFSAPSDDGGALITGYTVTASPGGATGSGTGSPITVSGLSLGSYTFTVTASNALGVGAASALAQATSSVLVQTHSADSDPGPVDNRTVPGAPTGVAAAGGIEQAVVSFSAPSDDGGALITGYTVTASPGGATGSGTSSPITVSGLTPGAYTFTVTASNTMGVSPASAPSEPPVTVVATRPVAIVAQLNIQSVALGQTATFEVSVDNGGLPVTYQWRKNGINISGATSATYTINNVTTGDLAAYSVVVSNALGVAASSPTALFLNDPTVFQEFYNLDDNLVPGGWRASGVIEDGALRIIASTASAGGGLTGPVLYQLPGKITSIRMEWDGSDQAIGGDQSGNYVRILTGGLQAYYVRRVGLGSAYLNVSAPIVAGLEGGSVNSVGLDHHFTALFTDGVIRFSALNTADGSPYFDFSFTNAFVKLDDVPQLDFGLTATQGTNWIDNLYIRIETAPTVDVTTQNISHVLRTEGVLQLEVYTGIAGNAVADLTSHEKYPNRPDEVFPLAGFDSSFLFPDASLDSFGARLSGFITPPVTGNYRFFLTSDDASELWLSTSGNPSGKVKIAEEIGCCQGYLATGPTASVPLPLVAGNAYYIEALWKEGSGGNDLRVAWRMPGEDLNDVTGLAPIPVQYLSADVGISSGGGSVMRAPSRETYTYGESVTLTAVPAAFYQFVRWDDGSTQNPRAITVGLTNDFTAIFSSTTTLEWQVGKQWDRSFGGSDVDEFHSLRVLTDGNVLLGGTSASGISGNKGVGGFGLHDYWLVKTDGGGNKIWEKAFGGSGHDDLWIVQTLPDGSILLGGASYSSNDGNRSAPTFGNADIWLVKLEANGNKIWDKAFGGSSYEDVYDIAVLPDGGFLLAGSTFSGADGNKSSGNFGSRDAWLVRVGVDGNLLWDRSFGGSDQDWFSAIQPTPDGGFLLGGTSQSPADGNKSAPARGLGDMWLVKVDAAGNKIWDKTFGGAGGDELKALVATSGGGFLLGGSAGSGVDGNKGVAGFGSMDFWLVKVDVDGGKLWEKVYGGDSEEQIGAIQPLADGGFLLGGISMSSVGGNKTSPGFGAFDYWLVRVDAAGAKLWDRGFGGTGSDLFQALEPTPDGGFVLGGASESGIGGNKSSPGLGGFDFWAVKIAANEVPSGAPQFSINGNSGSNFSFSSSPSPPLTLSSSFSGGTIRYTLDGSTPSLNSTLYTGPFTLSASATLRAIAFNPGGTQSALADPVQINLPPVVDPLLAVTVPIGTTANFIAVVNGGTLSVSYQWRKNGINIPGATSATYAINNVSTNDLAAYSVVVSNELGASTSSPAALFVNDPTVFQEFYNLDDNQTPAGWTLGDSATTGIANGFLFTRFGEAHLYKSLNVPGKVVRIQAEWDQPVFATDWAGANFSAGFGSPSAGHHFALTESAAFLRPGAGVPDAIGNYPIQPGTYHQTVVLEPGVMRIKSQAWGTGTVFFEDEVTNGVIDPSHSNLLNFNGFIFENTSPFGLWMDNLYVRIETAPLVELHQTGSGTMTKSPNKETYTYGEHVLLTATPERHHHFLRWSDDSTQNPRSISVGLTNKFTAIFTNTVPLEWRVVKQWERSFGTTTPSSLEEVKAIVPAPGGGCFVIINTGGDSYFSLARIDEAGSFLWLTNYPNLAPAGPVVRFHGESLGGAIGTADGGVLLFGHIMADDQLDLYVIKVDQFGQIQWRGNYGGPSAESFARSAVQLSDGGFLVGVTTVSGVGLTKTTPAYGSYDFWVVRFDSAGNQLWDQTFGGSSGDGFGAVELAGDGRFISAIPSGPLSLNGNKGTLDPGNYGHAWLVFGDLETGAKTTELALPELFQADNNHGIAFRRLADGGYILAGNAANDWNVRKLGENAEPIWNRLLGGTEDEFMRIAIPGSDGGVLAVGSSRSPVGGGTGQRLGKATPNFGEEDGWIVKLDASGNKLWEFNAGGTSNDYFEAVHEVNRTKVLVGGISFSSPSGNKTSLEFGGGDAWLISLATIEQPIGTPLVLVNGTYTTNHAIAATNTIQVAMTTSFPGGAILYTADGTDPFGGSLYTVPFSISSTSTIRAVALNSDFTESAESDPVTVEVVPVYALTTTRVGGTAASVVTLSPAGGQYLSNSVVTLTAVAGAGEQFSHWSGDVSENLLFSFVTVGDAGNAADTSGYGAVGYAFQMQKFEFTNGEYVEFLNAVGGSNLNGIYSSSMGSDPLGGITQSGASPNFTYAVKANMGDKPVNYVSWFDGARVANWLHNGRSTNPSLLETGAYTLNNAVSGVGFNKNVGATYWIPSENEWYKAAYYKGGGVSAGYWIFPTKSDSNPTYVTANSTGVGSAGLGSTANSINGNFNADWNGQDGNVTTVGSNGGPSAYGTYDMGGNVWEWDDTVVSGSSRVFRGGGWSSIANDARSDDRGSYDPGGQDKNLGFRLARSSVSSPGITTVRMDSARSVTATFFVIPYFTLGATTDGGGSVALSPVTGPYLSNTVVTATATSSSGWSFVGWTGDASGTQNPVSVTISGNQSVRAVFGTTLTTSVLGGAANGSVALSPASGPYPFGSTIRVSAMPAAGKYFSSWGGALTGAGASPANFVITNPTPTISAIMATLSANNFALNLTVNGNGNVTRSPQQGQYVNGTVVTLTATPTAGNFFAGWSGDASGTQNPLNVTLNASKSITAGFAPQVPPAIDVQPLSQSVKQGDTALLSVTASGTEPLMYQWRKDGVNLSGAGATSASYTISDARTNHSGKYSVVVNNAVGTATSTNATLSVDVVYIFSTLAGSASSGSADGPPGVARFNQPQGLTRDSAGNFYVADSQNHTIRKVTPAGVVSTFAGLAGVSGLIDGAGSVARFSGPYGVAVDSADNVYVADRGNNAVRKITPQGLVITVAGGSGGTADGIGSVAQFADLRGLAVDSSGVIYVADTGNHTIRVITPGGEVTTFAGLAQTEGSSDGMGSVARFSFPIGLVVDTENNLYVADRGNATIRKITSAGLVSTFAGLPGISGSDDGVGSSARFRTHGFLGLTFDGVGYLYGTEEGENKIRRISLGGVVTTFFVSGSGLWSSPETRNSAFRFSPSGLTADGVGNVYVTEVANQTIRKLTSSRVVTTLAGGGDGAVDGTGNVSRFDSPVGVAVANSGNVYVADTWNRTIRKITPGGSVSTLAGMALISGSADGVGSEASFSYPNGVAVDFSENIFVTDWETIRKITPLGVVTTIAGSPGSSGGVDGVGSAARFNSPYSVAVDSDGMLYVADYGGSIRKVTQGGVVTTLAGKNDEPGFVDGPGSLARFRYPKSIAVDVSGNVYVGDNNAIRKITPGGLVSTLCQNCGAFGLAVDAGMNLFMSDFHTIIKKVTQEGILSDIAGQPWSPGSADGIGTLARLFLPKGVAIAADGNLYGVDGGNHTIRKGTPIIPGTPVVSITSPVSSQILTAGTAFNVTANASATDGTIVKVEFFDTDTKIGEDVTSPYSISWIPSAGGHNVTAIATDSQGYTTRSPIVPVSASAAVNGVTTVSIVAPTGGAAFAAPAVVHVEATASAAAGDSITRVEFWEGVNKLGEDTTVPYEFNWSAVPAGIYTLTARAYVAAGPATVSTPVRVTVTSPTVLAELADLNNNQVPAGWVMGGWNGGALSGGALTAPPNAGGAHADLDRGFAVPGKITSIRMEWDGNVNGDPYGNSIARATLFEVTHFFSTTQPVEHALIARSYPNYEVLSIGLRGAPVVGTYHHVATFEPGVIRFKIVKIDDGQVAFEVATTNAAIKLDQVRSVHWEVNAFEATSWIDNLYLRVEFAPTVPALVQHNTGGVVTRSPSKEIYTFGETVTLTAVPKPYYRFVRWSDENTLAARDIAVGLTNEFVAIFEPVVSLERVPVRQLMAQFDGFASPFSGQLLRRAGDGGVLVSASSSYWPSSPMRSAVFAGFHDIALVKLDPQGAYQWDRGYGGFDNDFLGDVKVTQDGGFIVVGTSSSGISGNKSLAGYGASDVWVIKLSSLGEKQWEKVYGGTGEDLGRAVFETLEGRIIVAGYSASAATGNKSSTGQGAWVFALDSQGNKMWETVLGSNSAPAGFYETDPEREDILTRIVQGTDGDLLLGGRAFSPGGTPGFGGLDFWLVKIGSGDGAVQWQKFFGGADGNDTFRDMAMLSDGGVVMVGESGSASGTGNKTLNRIQSSADWWFVRTDASGQKIEEKVLGGSLHDVPFAIAPMSDGGFVIAGNSDSGADGTKTTPKLWFEDAWMTRLGRTGLPQWDFVHGTSTGQEGFGAIMMDEPDSMWVLGSATDGPTGFLLKVREIEQPIGTPLVLVNGTRAANHVIHGADSISVTMTTTFPGGHIFYTTDGSDPTGGVDYSGPIALTQSAVIRAVAFTATFENPKEAEPSNVTVVPIYSLQLSHFGDATVGAVSMNPSGGQYLSNSVVTLTATAINGWTFLGWRGDATGTLTSLNVTMNSDKSIQAVFGSAPTFTVSAGNGTISREPATNNYFHASNIRVSAVPAAGSYFRFWGGALSGVSVSPVVFTLTNPAPTISALFATLPVGTFALNVLLQGDGSVTKNPQQQNYASGAAVTLTATPAAGSLFAGWSGDASGTQNPLSVTMTASKNITAHFVSEVQGVTIQSPASGTELAAPATVTIEAGVVEFAATKVEFFEGATKLGEDTSPPFSFVWSNVPAGGYSLTAKATDAAAFSFTSTPVNFQVGEPPRITVQPQSKTAILNESVEFSATATGKTPLHYQWRTNGVDIPGAINPTYALTVTTALSGTTSYRVMVSNSVGTTNSEIALLTVSEKPGQIITSAALPDRTLTSSPFTLSATSSSGLPVGFAVVSGPARLVNETLYLTGVGTITVRASQAGDTSFAPATSVDRSFNVLLPPAPTETMSQGIAKVIVPYAANVSGLQYAIERQPSSGAITLDSDRFTYTPVPSFFGLVDFIYRITDPVTGVQTQGILVNLNVVRVDPVFSLAQATYSVGESGGTVTIQIRKNISAAGQVLLSTRNLTANKQAVGGDFDFAQEFLDFGSGETSRNVAITILNDERFEGDEIFEFQIAAASPAAVAEPSRASITILDDDSDLISKTVVLPSAKPGQTARLQVDLKPIGVEGRWRFLGQRQWSVSGVMSEGLPDGDYEIEFKPANGYAHPLPALVTLGNGVTLTHPAYYTPTLSPRLGSLTVTCVGTALAGWKFEEEPDTAYRASGTTVPGLNTGTYTIQFKPVDGFIAPGNLNAEVKNQSTQSYAVTYVAAPPSNTDRIKPAVVLFGFERYPFIGEISRSDGELGSGFVVNERVVLTAGHVLFDQRTLGNAKRVRWHFQRHRGSYEPKPQTPRGWNLYAGYAAQRTNDGVNFPSTPFSQNVDVAAMFFTEPAGRGGYGGYLASTNSLNEWLTGTDEKIISGYPIDGIPSGDQGKIHETSPQPVSLSKLAGLTDGYVYSSSQLLSYPGNSGGPLCVKSGTTFYPAGVFVASDADRIYVRSLDHKVVEMIAVAELSGRTGTNASGGGVTIVASSFVETDDDIGLLQVAVSPLGAVDAGAGWRVVGGDPNYISPSANPTRVLTFGYELEFKPVAGFITPANFSLQVAKDTTYSIVAHYQQTQTVTFPVIATQAFPGSPLLLNATASSGLAVQYELVSGPATLSGGTLTFTGVGSVTVRALQAGNDDFTAATAQLRTFEVVSASLLNSVISGSVGYYSSTLKVPGVTVGVSGNGVQSMTTGTGGTFSFTLGTGSDYTVTASKLDESPPSKGVTTLDITLIRRHILGIAALGSPHKLLAADVNGSSSVTTLDITFIRRLILGISTTLPKGLWQFVPSDFVFPNPNAPWNPDPSRHYTSLVTDRTAQDFTAIKVGDVNVSWTAPTAPPPPLGDSGSEDSSQRTVVSGQAGGRPLLSGEFGGGPSAGNPVVSAVAALGSGPVLKLVELEVGAEQGIEMPLKASGFKKVTSVQFSLRWDPGLIEFVGVGAGQLPGVGDGNFNTRSASLGQLSFSWDDPEVLGRDLGEQDALFILRFKAKSSGAALAVMEFGDLPTLREITADWNAVAWQSVGARVWVGTKRAELRVSIERRGTEGVSLLFPALAGAEFVVETADAVDGATWRTIGTVSGSRGIVERTLPLLMDREKSGFYRFRLMTPLP